MRTSVILRGCFSLLTLTAVAPLCHATELAPGAYVSLSSPANPFVGETVVDTVTSSSFSVYDTDYSVPISQWGATPPQYLAATGSITTTVYRALDGSLGFAYAITSQGFPQPFNGPPFNDVAIPYMAAAGFANTATDVSISRIPGSAMSVVRSTNGDSVQFNFSNSPDPSAENIRTFYTLPAGSEPLTVYIQTTAHDYATASSQLFIDSYDGRSTGFGNPSPFSFDSFSPLTAGSGAPVPEPASLCLVLTAVAGLAFRFRK